MKKYIIPKCELIEICLNDIITLSVGAFDPSKEDGFSAGEIGF